MVDVVNTVSGSGAVAPAVQQATVAPAPTTAATTTAAPTATPTPAAIFTHRLYPEPITGVLVTEQLDASGHVVSQTPANFVLAYLRNGLTADGEPKILASA